MKTTPKYWRLQHLERILTPGTFHTQRAAPLPWARLLRNRSSISSNCAIISEFLRTTRKTSVRVSSVPEVAESSANLARCRAVSAESAEFTCISKSFCAIRADSADISDRDRTSALNRHASSASDTSSSKMVGRQMPKRVVRHMGHEL